MTLAKPGTCRRSSSKLATAFVLAISIAGFIYKHVLTIVTRVSIDVLPKGV